MPLNPTNAIIIAIRSADRCGFASEELARGIDVIHSAAIRQDKDGIAKTIPAQGKIHGRD